MYLQLQFHILVIIADGQMENESTSLQAIVEASQFPLSLIMIGVGDGPWTLMKNYDDYLPGRKFDNFQVIVCVCV